MNVSKFSEKEIDKIINLYNSGLLQKEIASIFGVSKSSIGRCLRNNGITSKIVLSDDDISHIVEMYKNGNNIEYIASRYNIGDRRVTKILKENNVAIRTADIYNRRYTLNETYFDVIDTQEKAYIVGLLFADGCISEDANIITISLKEEDKDILLKINEELGSNRPLTYIKYNDKNSNWSNQYKLSINSRYMVNSLRNLGLFQNKSLKIEFPSWITDEYYFHFLRGYIDGDGCILKTEKRMSFIATENFCNNVAQYLQDKLSVHCSISLCHKKDDISTRDLRISGAQQVKKVLDKIYENANMRLDRKCQIYKALYLEQDNINNSFAE
jgi:intein-encoded DNA endonuclease-like protein